MVVQIRYTTCEWVGGCVCVCVWTEDRRPHETGPPALQYAHAVIEILPDLGGSTAQQKANEAQ